MTPHQMRLTLRTLLAYLDDMLVPAQTRLIGQKVAESDAAQELIARIKQVTRRRRLTVPPATGPGAFDPNTVAEYLDNTLSNDQVAEVEKVCLESDVHLAELAAVHQILTLVLGQPALVPPTAKQRMYGLVRGREAIPSRRVPVASARGEKIAEDADLPVEDEDSSLLLGLPMYRRQPGWVRWLLPLAGALVLAVLGIYFWHSLSSNTPLAQGYGKSRERNPVPGTQAKPVDTAPQPKPVDTAPQPKPVKPTETNSPTKPTKPAEPDTSSKPADVVPPSKPADVAVTPRPANPDQEMAPSKERQEIGRYFNPVGSAPNVLVSRPAAGGAWQRLSSNGKIMSTDRVVSLPGYHSEVRLDKGVHLILWGNEPEMVPFPLLESAAVLHVPAKGFDADITCDRGAFLISNHKENGPAVVRLRLQEEVWDLTLEPQTEIGLTLWGRYTGPYKNGEIPNIEVFLFVLSGRATVNLHKVEYRDLRGKPEPIMLYWDNKGNGIQAPAPVRDPLAKELLNIWAKPPATETVNQVQVGLNELSMRLGGTKAVSVALAEVLQSFGTDPFRHLLLAVRCLGAIDAVPETPRCSRG